MLNRRLAVDAVTKRSNESSSPGIVDLLIFFEGIVQAEDFNWLAFGCQGSHRGKDSPILWHEKISRANYLTHPRKNRRANKDCAKHGPLRLGNGRQHRDG